MYILNKLIPQNNNTMLFPKITRAKTLKLIDNLKPTNSRGYDDISNKILKLIKYDVEPIITHLINQIIDTEVFPDIHKLSRQLPLSKQGKCKSNIDSYRPINNLPAVEN